MARLDTKYNPARLESRAAGDCLRGSKSTPTTLVDRLVPETESPKRRPDQQKTNLRPPPPMQRRLADRRAVHVRRAGRVCTDHTGLVGEEPALPGRATVQGLGDNRVGHVLPARRGYTPIGELVATLAAAGQDTVNQVSRGRCGRVCRLQIAQRVRVAGPVGGGVSDTSRVDRPQRANRRRFVRRHLRTQQVGDGNRRDDQNDRHDDQKLDERKTLLPIPHTLSFDFYSSTRDTGPLNCNAGANPVRSVYSIGTIAGRPLE